MPWPSGQIQKAFLYKKIFSTASVSSPLPRQYDLPPNLPPAHHHQGWGLVAWALAWWACRVWWAWSSVPTWPSHLPRTEMQFRQWLHKVCYVQYVSEPSLRKGWKERMVCDGIIGDDSGKDIDQLGWTTEMNTFIIRLIGINCLSFFYNICYMWGKAKKEANIHFWWISV